MAEETALPTPLAIISVEALLNMMCFIDAAERSGIDEDLQEEALRAARTALRGLAGDAKVDFLRIAASLGERAQTDLGLATGTLDIARLEHRIGFLSDLVEDISNHG